MFKLYGKQSRFNNNPKTIIWFVYRFRKLSKLVETGRKLLLPQATFKLKWWHKKRCWKVAYHAMGVYWMLLCVNVFNHSVIRRAFYWRQVKLLQEPRAWPSLDLAKTLLMWFATRCFIQGIDLPCGSLHPFFSRLFRVVCSYVQC